MFRKSLLFIIVILSGCAGANIQRTPSGQEVTNNTLRQKLTGIWEFKGMRISNPYNQGFRKAPPGQFKVYSGDGAFTNFGMSTSGAVISSEGAWKVISDSILVEHVSRSIHKGLAGKNDTLYFNLNDKGFLYLKWHRNEDNNGIPANVWIEEHWRKVGLHPEAGLHPDPIQKLRQSRAVFVL